jgi:hypothetical protein
MLKRDTCQWFGHRYLETLANLLSIDLSIDDKMKTSFSLQTYINFIYFQTVLDNECVCTCNMYCINIQIG